MLRCKSLCQWETTEYALQETGFSLFVPELPTGVWHFDLAAETAALSAYCACGSLGVEV